jgi:hypothetical protein
MKSFEENVEWWGEGRARSARVYDNAGARDEWKREARFLSRFLYSEIHLVFTKKV